MIKKNGGGHEFKYDIFDICKNFCKCHSIPPSNITGSTTVTKILIKEQEKFQ
jgi:hypothetical protein